MERKANLGGKHRHVLENDRVIGNMGWGTVFVEREARETNNLNELFNFCINKSILILSQFYLVRKNSNLIKST